MPRLQPKKKALRQALSSSTDPVLVGLIGKPFGMDGHVTVRVESDDPERFVVGAEFPGIDGGTLVVENVRPADKGIHLRFVGYHTRDSAEKLRGHSLTVPEEERRQLDKDEFWPDELIGLRVQDAEGESRGVVSDYVEGAAQDRLLITSDSGLKFEVPFVLALVPEVDVAGGTVTINAIDGLTD